MMKPHKKKRIAGALLIACLITQGSYSQGKREHTEPPGPGSLEPLGSGAEWTTPFPGFSWTEHPKAFSEVGEPVEYEIQIATDADFETLVDEDRVALNRYVHDAPFPPGQYHWRVRAIPYGEDPTNWSAPQDFTIRDADLVVTVVTLKPPTSARSISIWRWVTMCPSSSRQRAGYYSKLRSHR